MNSIQTIPLAKLSLSPHNARKTGGTHVEDLAASILAHGLLQNLTVTPAGDDKFEVVAGGRRLRALQLLRTRGSLPDALTDIPCRMIANGEIAEASTAENVIREAMHPADQFDAFKRMVDDKKPITDIAAHFGLPEIVVKQRLRLANVSPKLIALFRENKATLAQMIALSISDDHAHQEKIWAAARGDWQREPNHLREAIVGKKLPANKGIAAFVGIKDYEAAGGIVVRDLFGEEAYLADPGLVERLALKKLQERADLLKADGWNWAEPRSSFDYDARQKFRTIDAEWKGGKATFTAEAKAAAGAVVSIDRDGKIELHLGLLKAGQKAPSTKKPSPVEKRKQAAKTEAAGLSMGAQSALAGLRTAIARSFLADNPRQMLALLAANLASRYLANAPVTPRVVLLDRDHRANGMQEFRQALEEAPQAEACEILDRDLAASLRKSVGKGDLFPWLLKQPEEITHKLLAAVSAGFVNLALGEGDAAAIDLGIDFGKHWQVGEAWLSTLQKGTVLTIVREAYGKTHDAALQPLSKTDVAKRAAELLAGTGWLPKPLRGSGYALRKPGAAKPDPKAAAKPAAKKPAKKAKPKKAPAKKKPAKKPAKKITPKLPAKS